MDILAYLHNPIIGGIVAVLASSLVVSVANKIPPLKKVHKSILASVPAVLFTFLLTSFEGVNSFSDGQWLVFKFLAVVTLAIGIAITRGQMLGDWIIDKATGAIQTVTEKVLSRAVSKVDEQKPPDPPAIP